MDAEIEKVINMLDDLTFGEVSRIKVEMDEMLPEDTCKKEYHHGRCDIGSPFARGCAFDVLEPEQE